MQFPLAQPGAMSKRDRDSKTHRERRDENKEHEVPLVMNLKRCEDHVSDL